MEGIRRGLPEGRGTRQEFLPFEVADCWDDMLRNYATVKARKAREEGVCALTVILLDSHPNGRKAQYSPRRTRFEHIISVIIHFIV